MALVTRRQPSAVVSTGLSVATAALNIAGAAADAVPIAKQILNSAAHISAFAERIQKKREAMHTLIRKTDVYSTQIDIAVAGRVLDARLQQRLARLLSVFVKIEALLEDKAGRKKYPVRVWNKFIAKPNRTEELAGDLDHEMTLFNLLTGIQLSLTVEDTACAVANEALYDGQFRRLRDCDVEKLDVIHKDERDTEVVVWSSARVDGQLMVVRHVEPVTPSETNDVASRQSLSASYNEFLKNIEKVSTISGSHRYIVQLYGRHVRGPEAVFKSGTIDLDSHLLFMSASKTDAEEVAMKFLRLAYKILDASAHLEDVHGLAWVGRNAVVDENGEPRIGLFNDIIRSDSVHLPPSFPWFYWNIFTWTNHSYSEETGVVEQVHDSSLHPIITEQLRHGNDTDHLRRVWDIIRQEQLHVGYQKSMFPIISGNLSLSQELIARARSYFETNVNEKDPRYACEFSFVRHALATGGANISSQICICMMQRYGKGCTIRVDAYTHDENHIQSHWFWIHIPTGGPLLAEIARTAGLPDDFEYSWAGSDVYIYPQLEEEGDSEVWGWGSSEEEDEEYETADEGDEL